MMKYIVLTFALLVCAYSKAQLNISLRLQPSTQVTNAPAVHSGTYGIYNGKWFFIGGRKNGLHGFQPPFAFEGDGINDTIYIVDRNTNQVWKQDVYSLPAAIREPITSSNMQFYLQDSTLYMVGGYGWKDSIQNFITWPTLTAVNVSGLMDAVMSNATITPYFRQIEDSVLTVCGSHLHKLDSTYYLVFGHRFDGYYDRSDTTGFHFQEYTHEIRKFQIHDDGVNLSLANYNAVRDTANFRRRDFNLIPFYNPWTMQIGLTAYSGVFRKNTVLPYLNCVDIYDTTYRVRNEFNQNMNQYHSAVCALYDSANITQHNLMFGGMSMYYIDTVTNTKRVDSLIPFVQTITDVVRNLDNDYFEFNAGIRMPVLLGTNAYFMLNDTLPMYKQHFIHLNHLGSSTLLGYIVGGIQSPELNISDTDPSLSTANAVVYEVYLDRTTVGMQAVQNDVLNFYCYPNPVKDYTEVHFELKGNEQVQIELCDATGKVISEVCNRRFDGGKQKLRLDMLNYPSGVYNCVITVNSQRKSIRLKKG